MTFKNPKIAIMAIIAVAAISIPATYAIHENSNVFEFCENANLEPFTHKFNFMCDVAVDHEKRLASQDTRILSLEETTQLPAVATYIVEKNTPNDGTLYYMAQCTSPDKAIAGGYHQEARTNAKILSSLQNDAYTWIVILETALPNPTDLTVFATCLDLSPIAPVPVDPEIPEKP